MCIVCIVDIENIFSSFLNVQDMKLLNTLKIYGIKLYVSVRHKNLTAYCGSFNNTCFFYKFRKTAREIQNGGHLHQPARTCSLRGGGRGERRERPKDARRGAAYACIMVFLIHGNVIPKGGGCQSYRAGLKSGS